MMGQDGAVSQLHLVQIQINRIFKIIILNAQNFYLKRTNYSPLFFYHIPHYISFAFSSTLSNPARFFPPAVANPAFPPPPPCISLARSFTIFPA